MKIKAFAKFIYGLFGTLFLVAGLGIVSLGTNLLPNAVQNIVINVAHGDPTALHLLQEFASLLVFAGLMSFWSVRHYEQSKPFHWAMTTFWGLLALVHWFDARGTFHAAVGPLINTIPFALFGLIGLLRIFAESKSSDVLPRR